MRDGGELRAFSANPATRFRPDLWAISAAPPFAILGLVITIDTSIAPGIPNAHLTGDL